MGFPAVAMLPVPRFLLQHRRGTGLFVMLYAPAEPPPPTTRGAAGTEVQVVIPVRDEAGSIARVVSELRGLGLRRIRVVDNGSSDGSADLAAAAGAEVLQESRAGYGRACWRGCLDLDPSVSWILFCDGDGSDALETVPALLDLRRGHELILGDRTASAAGRSRLSQAQRFGNRLATHLIRLGWGHRYRDLGPLRLVSRSSFEAMALRDRGFGWTIEMQIRALELRLPIAEVPVPYRPRQAGRSKISGDLWASCRAGAVILLTLGRLWLRRWVRPGRWRLG